MSTDTSQVAVTRTEFPYEVDVIPHVWIPTADGTRLSARIWMPRGRVGERFPVVLEAIPYRKDDATLVDDALRFGYIAGHGYVGVRLDLRGSGDSEGTLDDEYSPREQADIIDVIDWLADQAWSSGAVGMTGISWSGFNSLQVAFHRPPALRAIITVCSTDDRYDNDVHYMGGSVLGFYMNWWGSIMHGFNVRPPDPAVVGDAWREMWLERLRVNPHLHELWLSHQRRDGFWKQGSVIEDYPAIECPTLLVGGWEDAYTDAIFRMVNDMPGFRRAIIGPWGHTWPERGVPGPVIGFLQENLRWWDQWLKGIDRGVQSDPVVRYWLQDTVEVVPDLVDHPGRWMEADGFISVAQAPRRFHLTADGLFSAAPTVAERVDHQSPLTVGREAGHWLPMGSPLDLPREQSPDDAGSMVFDTPVLSEAVHVVGQPVVTLKLSADLPHANVFVRLEEVTADGVVNLITRGALNLTHRDSHEFPEPLEPGRDYTVEVPLKVIAQTIPAGHRMRIAVSTNYWPWIWPPAQTPTVSLELGPDSYLTIPEVADDDLVELRRPFEPAEVSPAEIVEVLESRIPYWRNEYDQETGTHLIARSTGSVLRQRTPSGMTLTGIDEARHLIKDGDPLSAVMECERNFAFAREGWRVSVSLFSRLRCTAKDFVVETRMTALEGDSLVFSEDRLVTIPRDFN